MNIGMFLFNDINAAVATYSVFSIVMMALSFAYVVSTIYRASSNIKISIIIAIWYLIMPFHIQYSYTMWKDILFGATVTVFAVSTYRILKNIGSNIPNYIIMIITAIGFCLLRSNGYFAFFFGTVIFCVLYKKQKKLTLIGIFIAVLACTYVLKHPVLNALGVTQPDTIESLSIPAQQIARVVTDNKKLTDSQYELLSKVIDVESIPNSYSSGISDPVKGLVRASKNQDYIKEHKFEYIRLWVELGLKYPKSYVKAWVDETKGYWNAGYNYWRWGSGVQENTLGITKTVNVPQISHLYSVYCDYLFTRTGCRTFLCIGLYTWLTVISAWRSFKQKNKEGLFVCVPYLMVVISLCVATPVFAEFRYDYAVFCGMPFILMVSSTYFTAAKEKCDDGI